MKNILIILFAMLIFASTTNAQKYNRGFSGTVDTLQGADSDTYAFAGKIEKHSGFVAFNGTMVNTADSCASIIMQGSFDNTNWTAVSTLAATNVTHFILTEEDPDYLYYRLYMSTASGDTVNVTAINFIYKED